MRGLLTRDTDLNLIESPSRYNKRNKKNYLIEKKISNWSKARRMQLRPITSNLYSLGLNLLL
jgi:hypothetical protein